jgi:sec-independent protein translocase protein TatA
MWAILPNMGVPELVVILAIVFLLFGAKQMPEIARSIGRSLQEFKKGVKDTQQSIEGPESKT